MWQTRLIWRIINTPLPNTNPFYKLPLIAPKKIVKKRKPFYSPLLLWMVILGGFLACMGCFSIVVLFSIGSVNIIFAITLPFIIFYGFAGGDVSLKITAKLGKMRSLGISDLIAVTSDGIYLATWQIGQIIYHRIDWIKSARIVMRVGIYLVSLSWVLTLIVQGAGVIMNTLSLASFWSLVTEITNLGFLMILVYVSFIQAIIMGFLVGIWSALLTADDMTRWVVTIGAFLGEQLVLYLVAYLLLITTLSHLYPVTNWSTSLISHLMQLVVFMFLIEIQIQGMLRLLARQAELPYAVWASELNISQK
ncbi:MAG: hypothetical protein SFZ02_19520 [bacterium]|nr:hypothetical protein [bacterium]